MNNRGILVVLSGFSGAGKGTLMKRLFELHGEEYALSVSATTRKPREGEEEGKAYFFKTNEEFEKMIREDAFLEYAGYCDHYYGTPRAYVEEQLEKGKNVILEIEIQGARKIKAKNPEALLIFIAPPSMAELKNRLVGRGTETPQVIESRLHRAAEESQGVEEYDYLLLNDELEICVDELHRIIQSEHSRISRNLGFIQELRKEASQLG